MRSTFGNSIDTFYGSLTIVNLNTGAPIGPLNVVGASGLSALLELAGNGTVPGTSSLAIGQTAAGLSTILARGAQALNIGVNSGGQIAISSAGALTITDTTGTLWGAATGGAKGAGTINANGLFVNGVAVSTGAGGVTTGSFTITLNGLTVAQTAMANWTKVGTAVILSVPGMSGTSNANTMNLINLPVAIQPTTPWNCANPVLGYEDNNVVGTVQATAIVTGSIIQLNKGGLPNAWTTTNGKGLVDTIFVWDTN